MDKGKDTSTASLSLRYQKIDNYNLQNGKRKAKLGTMMSINNIKVREYDEKESLLNYHPKKKNLPITHNQF